MNEVTKSVAVSVLAIVLASALPGCGESSSPSASSHSADDDHDHGEAGHDDHGHDQDAGGHDGHEHGGERSLGSVAAGGATLDVSISGDPEPGAKIQVDLEHTGGPAPAAVRLWIGEESAEGALKAKADAHEGHFHARVEAPAEITETTELWLEIETADGQRSAVSVPLKN